MKSDAERYFELTSTLFIALDVNHKITKINKMACDFLGYPQEKLIGKNWVENFIIDENRKDTEKYFDHLLSGHINEIEHNENELIGKDGKTRIFRWRNTLIRDDNENITGFLSAGEDITEEYKTAKQLQDYADWLNLATESAEMGIWDIDLVTGEVLWDKNMCELYGLTFGVDIPNQETWGEFVHPEDIENADIALEKALSGLKDKYKNQFRIVLKDGTIRYIKASAALQYDSDGKPIRLIGVNWDVTDEQKLIDENIHLQKQFYQSQKMESIGQLAGGIAHDFNNLLVPIIGYSEMGMSMVTDNADLSECFTEIEKAGTKAAQLTRQILAFSRRQLLEMVPLDLTAVVNEFSKMLKLLVGEEISFTIKNEDALKPISGDQSQIEQVILNLLINARDSIKNNGVIKIKTKNILFEHDLNTDKLVIPKGAYTLLSISDNGEGIEPSIIDHIFEPFFTTKPRERGTGLGLSTVFGIIKQHGAYITVESTLDIGTCFRLYFPSLSEMNSVISPVKKTRQKADEVCNAATIFVVEDDEMVRKLLCKTIKREGYKVIEAESAESALQKINTTEMTIDLLLTDIILPGMDGHSLATEFKSRYKDLKIIYSSGYSEKINLIEQLDSKREVFIQKPFIPGDILNTLYRLLNRSELRS
ncbi:MAG: PAS domain S-box protein [Spirochaetales bacterium]|nr:PAS domain S-box protein [Spirochaetales bacterium]